MTGRKKSCVSFKNTKRMNTASVLKSIPSVSLVLPRSNSPITENLEIGNGVKDLDFTEGWIELSPENRHPRRPASRYSAMPRSCSIGPLINRIRSFPDIPIQHSILNRFAHVSELDVVGAFNVGDRSR